MNGIVLGYAGLLAIAAALAFMYALRAGIAAPARAQRCATDGAKHCQLAASRCGGQQRQGSTWFTSWATHFAATRRRRQLIPTMSAGFVGTRVSGNGVLLRVGYLFRWQWAWMAMAFWIPAMALSRLYLDGIFLATCSAASAWA
jgi:hypothetical protein